jgi:hypothetical protein
MLELDGREFVIEARVRLTAFYLDGSTVAW